MTNVSQLIHTKVKTPYSDASDVRNSFLASEYLMYICSQKNYKEQVLINNKLTKEVKELQEEAKLTREIPQILSESLTTCKDIYNDVLSVMQVK